MKFNGHKYTYIHPWSSSKHNWELRGPKGGINFHVSIMDDIEKYPDPSCGLEYHYCSDPSAGGRAPDHLNCPVVGGRCWHEGTSLYASETLWPAIEPALKVGAHSEVFRMLEAEYRLIEETLQND